LDEGVTVINTLCKKFITLDFASGDIFFPRVLIYPNIFIQGQYVYNNYDSKSRVINFLQSVLITVTPSSKGSMFFIILNA
jgi:hypothetical protein